MGYRVVLLPNKPVFGSTDVADINYNLPVFDPLRAAIQEGDLAITCHALRAKSANQAVRLRQ